MSSKHLTFETEPKLLLHTGCDLEEEDEDEDTERTKAENPSRLIAIKDLGVDESDEDDANSEKNEEEHAKAPRPLCANVL